MVFCGGIEHRHRRTEHIAHCIAEPPPAALPRTAVENLRPQRLAFFWKFIDRVEVWRGVPVERGFGEEGDAVSKDVSEIQKTRIPVIKANSMDRSGHAVLIQIRRHVYPVRIQ